MQKSFIAYDDFQDNLQSWKKILQPYTKRKQFKKIYEYLKQQYAIKQIFPKAQNIFNAFKLTPINKLKVVIVGQDPYFQPGQAHGLCFSVQKPVPPPPSLKNIYKVLEQQDNIKFKKPNHGDLTNWAQQGILMLNAILTVQRGKPESHKNSGWQQFTDFVIEIVNKQCSDIIFLLWGKPAQKKAKKVDRKKHHIIQTSHPSPLGAGKGFLTSKCFSKCNGILKKLGKQEIDWNI